MYAAMSILGALNARARTGKGQKTSITLYDTAVSVLVNVASNYLSEALGDTVVLVFGPEKPFTEAAARTAAVAQLRRTMMANCGAYMVLLNPMVTGTRFGSTPDGACVARAALTDGGGWCMYASANFERLVIGCIEADFCTK